MTTKTQEATSSKAATGHKKEKFAPIVFGNANPTKERRILGFYGRLINVLNSIVMGIDLILFSEQHNFEIDFFIDLLKINHTEKQRKFIFAKFVELNSISVPGIDTQKLIEKEMLELKIPDELVSDLESFNSLYLAYSNENIGFAYPIRKLYLQTNNTAGVFTLNEDFSQAMKTFYQIETETEEQNTIYNSLKVIANNLNQLFSMGLITANTYESFLDLTIDTDRFNKIDPFSVSPLTFRRRILNEHRIHNDEYLPGDYLFL